MVKALPDYLNEDFFRDALAQTLKAEVKILELRVKYQKISGSYCSDIYRVAVKYTVKQPTVVKTCPIEVREVQLFVKDLFETLVDNSREHLMYATVLPELHVILEAAGIRSQLSPKAYLTRKLTGETHILEDLEATGYSIHDRLMGFNVLQTRAVLKKLAHFHAASMIYIKKHPEIVASMKGFYCASDAKCMDITQKLIDDNTKYVTKIVETWPGYEQIAQKMLRNTGAHFRRKFLNTLQKQGAKINVIIHGDLWIRNIFLRQTAEGNDVILFDYQNSCEASPALDLINLFLTSVQLKVLKNNRVHLIKYYYAILYETLNLLHYSAEAIPTLQDVLDELRRVEYYNYYSLIFSCAQSNLSEKLADDMDFYAFSDEQRLARNRQDMYSNARVLATYKLELKRLDDLGVLD